MAVRWVRPGRDVAVATAAAIVELQAGDRLGEVIVVVPPGPTAATLRRLLPRVSGGVAGIRFLTPIDLAVELVDSSISTMRAVTTQLQLAAVTSVLSSDECPTVLREVRNHPATIDALVEMAMALRAAHVTPGALRALTGSPESVRWSLVDVVVRARERLVAVGVRDESATLAALDAVDEGALVGLRVVLVVTDAFHPAQVPFLRRLTDQRSCRLVAVAPARDDAVLADQLRAFGCATFPDSEQAAIPRVVSCPDPDEEVRYAVRQCASLLDCGVPADEIAIVCAAPQYRRPVRDELQRGGIAWTGGAVERLRGSVAGQVLRHLLDGVVEGWDRPNVFRLLSVAPLHPVGELGAPRWVGQWTSLCRRLGLVTVDDWTRASEALAEANHARRQRWLQGDVDAPPTRRELADDDALRRLLALVDRLHSRSRRLQRAASWEAASKALGAILVDHIGAATWRERAWADAPAWQRNAADHVERICAGLAELDHDGVAVPFTTATMYQIVATLLDSPVRRRGDAAGAVSILDVAGAVCIGATHVFIVGLNEGLLPVSTVDDLLLGRDLPDAAAAVIEGPRAFASRAERAWRSLLHSDASITATMARTDLRRGGEMYPSPLLAGMPIEKHESHAAGLLDGPLLTASEQLARSEGSHAQSPRLARRTNALRARLDPQPTEFDGMVGPHPALAPIDKQWAITALERQAVCGLAYFGQYVLHVSEETDAASIVSIEPADRGVLVHRVFEQLAGEWLRLDTHERPSWLRGDHLTAMHRRAVEILDELATDIGVQHRLGHASAWGAERAHILRSISATIDAEAVEGSQPVACEYSFSGVPVAGAQFRGNIDRIDQMADGGLRVTDFKTGAKSTLKDVLDGGRKLQLPLYARAADHDRAALVDEEHADAPAATARYLYVREAKAEARQVPIDATLIAEFESYITRWLGEIAGGQFAPRPHPTNGRCLMCCVDSLGVEDLAERARLFDPVGAQAAAEGMETEG